jgi:hypothetical protein
MPITNPILTQIDTYQALKQKLKAARTKRDQFQIDLDAIKAQIQIDSAELAIQDAAIITAIKALP